MKHTQNCPPIRADNDVTDRPSMLQTTCSSFRDPLTPQSPQSTSARPTQSRRSTSFSPGEDSRASHSALTHYAADVGVDRPSLQESPPFDVSRVVCSTPSSGSSATITTTTRCHPGYFYATPLPRPWNREHPISPGSFPPHSSQLPVRKGVLQQQSQQQQQRDFHTTNL